MARLHLLSTSTAAGTRRHGIVVVPSHVNFGGSPDATTPSRQELYRYYKTTDSCRRPRAAPVDFRSV